MGQTGVTPLFSRDDSLAFIKKAVFVPYNEKNKKANRYFESVETSRSVWKVASQLWLRLSTEGEELVDYGRQVCRQAYGLLSEVTSDLGQLLKNLEKLNKVQGSTDYDLIYRQRQLLVLLTRDNQLVALDSQQGAFKWRTRLDRELVDMFPLEQKKNDQLRHSLLVATRKNKVLTLSTLDVETGATVSEEKVGVDVKRIVQIEGGALMIIDHGDKVRFFPETHKPEESMQLREIDGQAVIGRMIQGKEIQELWRLNLPSQEKLILSSGTNQHLAEMARGVKTQLMDESKVIYQAINYNNLAVVTKDSKRE